MGGITAEPRPDIDSLRRRFVRVTAEAARERDRAARWCQRIDAYLKSSENAKKIERPRYTATPHETAGNPGGDGVPPDNIVSERFITSHAVSSESETVSAVAAMLDLDPNELIPHRQALAELGVSRATLYRWRTELPEGQRLDTYQGPRRGRLWFRRGDLIEFLRKHGRGDD